MTRRHSAHRLLATIAAVTIAASGVVLAPLVAPLAASAADPTVALVGTLQSEIGCASDWAPDCSKS